MQDFGDLFPGAENLDELLEQLARRMAAASQLMASMTPEQRDQLAGLAEQLMSDMDLAWQLDRLGENLRDHLPDAGWTSRSARRARTPLDPRGQRRRREMAELAELRSY